MAIAIRFHEPGGPDSLRLETVEVGTPRAGQVRLLHHRRAMAGATRAHFDLESRRTTGSSILVP